VCVSGVCLTLWISGRTGFPPCRAGDPASQQPRGLAPRRAREPGALAFASDGLAHIVQGHIDGTANSSRLNRSARTTGGSKYASRLNSRATWWRRLCALDGISLTIAAIEGDELSAAIIPHTTRTRRSQATARRPAEPGVRHPAKHVEKLLQTLNPARVTVDKLRTWILILQLGDDSAATSRAFSIAPVSKLMAPTRGCPPPPYRSRWWQVVPRRFRARDSILPKS